MEEGRYDVGRREGTRGREGWEGDGKRKRRKHGRREV